MSDIYGCKCSECKKWHSHVFPNQDGFGKFICVDCKRKKEVEK